MLRAAHFVSLHCPLTPETRGLLGRREFGLMQPGALIVNYARGEVIDKLVRSRASRLSYCMHVIVHAALPGVYARMRLPCAARGCSSIACAHHSRPPELAPVQALLEALRSGQVGGAGLDVHWQEPADPDEPLYQHPNVIATPHTGVCTHDVVDVYASLLCENIVRRHDGRELLHQLM